jgi:alkaline phosphatase
MSAYRPASWRILPWLFALLAIVGGCAGRPSAEASGATRPKNIIILFADRVAPVQWEFGRYTSQALRKTSFATTDLVFRDGVLGLMSTYPHDSMVTDSAAGGSAMSTGVKVNNGAVSMAPDGTPRRTVMQAAGKRIGLISTAEIHDASPAAFSVNARDQRDGQAIVDQYFAPEPDVLFGGGAISFCPRGGQAASVPTAATCWRPLRRRAIASFARRMN